MFQTLMGVFYYIKAVALLEDLPLEEAGAHSSEDVIANFVGAVEAGYSQVSDSICEQVSHWLGST